MGTGEPRLPTATGRLSHGNLLVVDVIGGVGSRGVTLVDVADALEERAKLLRNDGRVKRTA